MNARSVIRPDRLRVILAMAAVLLCASVAPADEAATATLTAVATGFRSDAGHALASLYDDPDGFPSKPDKAFRKVRAEIRDGRARLVFADIPPGTYGLAVIHDENDSGALDTNWVGMPKEGIGVSNDAKGRMGPPKYDAARFEVAAPATAITLKMKYL